MILRTPAVIVVAMLALSSCATGTDEGTPADADRDDAAVGATSEGGVPQFEYDPTWPTLPLPNQWILGEVGGLGVDAVGHVWVIIAPGP